jgi:hypothetical protein
MSGPARSRRGIPADIYGEYVPQMLVRLAESGYRKQPRQREQRHGATCEELEARRSPAASLRPGQIASPKRNDGDLPTAPRPGYVERGLTWCDPEPYGGADAAVTLSTR